MLVTALPTLLLFSAPQTQEALEAQMLATAEILFQVSLGENCARLCVGLLRFCV